MARLRGVWPDEGSDDFGPIFDEAMVKASYGSHVVLHVPRAVAQAGEQAWQTWIAAHRPPAPWDGLLVGLTTAEGPCPADCAHCAAWRQGRSPS